MMANPSIIYPYPFERKITSAIKKNILEHHMVSAIKSTCTYVLGPLNNFTVNIYHLSKSIRFLDFNLVLIYNNSL